VTDRKTDTWTTSVAFGAYRACTQLVFIEESVSVIFSVVQFHFLTIYYVQDKLRMCGAKAERHVFLFKRALLVAKKRDDVTMSVKAFIEVTKYLNYTINAPFTPPDPTRKLWRVASDLWA